MRRTSLSACARADRRVTNSRMDGAPALEPGVVTQPNLAPSSFLAFEPRPQAIASICCGDSDDCAEAAEVPTNASAPANTMAMTPGRIESALVTVRVLLASRAAT